MCVTLSNFKFYINKLSNITFLSIIYLNVITFNQGKKELSEVILKNETCILSDDEQSWVSHQNSHVKYRVALVAVLEIEESECRFQYLSFYGSLAFSIELMVMLNSFKSLWVIPARKNIKKKIFKSLRVLIFKTKSTSSIF